MGSFWSHNSSHRFEKLVRAGFGSFLKHFFFRIFSFCYLWGFSNFISQIMCFIFSPGLASDSLKVFLFYFYIFSLYQRVSILYIFLIRLAFYNIFYDMISTQQKKKWKGKRVATGKTCQTPSLWLKNLKEYITIHLLLVVCLLLHVFFFFFLDSKIENLLIIYNWFSLIAYIG